MIFKFWLILIGYFVITAAGRECPEHSKPHLTRCDMYFKCTVLPSNNHVWVPTNCDSGLIYEPTLKICVLASDEWECTLGDNKKPLRNNDESNIYGINNFEYLDHNIDGYIPELNIKESNTKNGNKWKKDNQNTFLKDDAIDKKESSEINSDENIVVVNSDNDDNEIDVSDDEVIPFGNNQKQTATIQPTTIAFNDDGSIESSGDGLENDDKVETKENYIAIPMSSDPKSSVASHLQRLTQLVQSLSDSQTNQSQTYDLSPNELNNFLANHNIQTEYQKISNENKVKIPENGHIHPTYMSEILELQKKLQDIMNMEHTNLAVASTTEKSIIATTTIDPEPFAYYLNKMNKASDSNNPENTKIHIKSNTPTGIGLKNPNNGYSSSQIVINRPEGSVLFSIPASYPSNSPSNKNVINEKHDPYITADTLKTILELSKQMISSSNNQYSLDQAQKYLQPIVRPIYYNIPIVSEYESQKSNLYKTTHQTKKQHSSSLNMYPNRQDSLLKSPNFDLSDYESIENSNPNNGNDHSTIIHTHIPITIEGNAPSPSYNRPDVKKNNNPIFSQQTVDESKDSINYNHNKPSMYPDSMFNNPSRPNLIPSQQYQSASQFSYYPSIPYSNNYNYQQGNSQLYPPNQQKYSSYNTSPPPLLPTQSDFFNYYTPTPHMNDQNANSFLYNFNAPFYPTIKPFSYKPLNFTSSSSYMTPNQMYPNQIYPNQIYPNQMFSNQIMSPMDQMNTAAIHSQNVERVTESTTTTTTTTDSTLIKRKKNSNKLRDDYISSYDDEVNEDDDNGDNISDETNENINNSNIMTKLYDSLNSQSSSSFGAQSLLDTSSGITGNGDNKKRIVNFGGNFISYDMFQKNIAPLLANNGGISSDIEVITCVTGARQPNKTDCTRYFVCNSKTGNIMPYICPPYTAFNSQSRFCDAKTYSTCNPVQIQTQITIDENRRIQMKAQQELNEANRVRDEALKTQRLAAMIRQQTENMLLKQQQHLIKKQLPITNSMAGTSASQHPIPILYQMTTSKPLHPKIRKITCRETGKQPDVLSKFNYFLCYRGSDNIMRARKMTCPGALIFCRATNLCTSTSRCGTI